MRILALAVPLLCCACNPVLVPTPLQLGETAPALGAGDISITVQAGAGVGRFSSGGGGAVRARVGVGNGQELGIEGFSGYADTGNNRYTGQFGGAKGSYKIELDPHFALIAGAGFGTSPTGSSAGGDLAAVVSATGDLRPYLGVRGSLAGRITGSGPGVAAVNIPAGLSYAVGKRVRLFAEGGLAGIYSGQHTGLLYMSAGLSLEVPSR